MITTSLLAYIGPGLGAGVVATVIGVILAVFLALFAILWYPFKRLIKSMKKSDDSLASDKVPNASAGGE